MSYHTQFTMAYDSALNGRVTVEGRGGEITISSKDIYSVQGSTLTIETTRSTPGGEISRKLIYTKS